MNNLQLQRRDFLWGLVGLCTSVLLPRYDLDYILKGEGEVDCDSCLPDSWIQNMKRNYSYLIDYDFSYDIGRTLSNLQKGYIDFAITNLSFSSQTMQQLVGDSISIYPLNLGAIALIYNNQDIDNISINSKQLSDIFLGKITNWQELGSSQSKKITLVYQHNNSGINSHLNEYLISINPNLKSSLKSDKKVLQFAGIGAKGSRASVATVQQIDGSIAYVENSWVKKYQLETIKIIDKIDNQLNNHISFSTDDISQDSWFLSMRNYLLISNSTITSEKKVSLKQLKNDLEKNYITQS